MLAYIVDILCLGCHVFHPPRIPVASDRYLDCNKDLLAHDDCDELQLLNSHLLPIQLHFSFLAAVMRSHRHGWTTYTTGILSSSYRLYQQPSPVYINQNASSYPRYYSYTICKIVDGRLLAKTEISMVPCEDLKGLADAACIPSLLKFLHESELRECICLHHWWTVYYDYIFNERAASTRYLLKLHPDRRPPLVNNSSQVHSCLYCYTDFTLSVTDLPLNDTYRRVFVLTTWKDLGSGKSLNDPRWNTHLFYYRPKPQPKIRHTRYGADICRAFEQLEKAVDGYVYYPVPTRIDAESIKDLSS